MAQEILLGLPIIIISVWTVLIITMDAFTGNNKTINFVLSILGLIAVVGSAAYTLTVPQMTINSLSQSRDLLSAGMITFGGIGAYFDIIFALAGILTLLASREYIQTHAQEFKEFYSLILFAVCGMIYISHANNMFSLFIGIELMSISFYALSGIFRNKISSVESALKYFLLGAFSTGFLLYGMAMIYGAAGSFSFPQIQTVIYSGEASGLYLNLGIGLMIVGLSFKIAAFPFHQWAPDVYQGAPTVVTAFMSTAGKAAAAVAFILIAKTLMPVAYMTSGAPAQTIAAQSIIAVLAALTMLIGNITALVQKNIKRMLAYSSVAHAGYILVGIAANNETGWQGVTFYATAYMFMQIGAFIIVSILEGKEEKNLNLEDYSGLRKSHPVLAAMMAVFMFSLAGIPPFAGFFGKYLIFKAAIESGFTWLTIVAVISSIISMYFYIGLIVYMYFKDNEKEDITAKPKLAGITIAIAFIGILFFGLFPSTIIDIAQRIL